MRCAFWTLLYKNFRLRPCEQALRSTAYTRTAVSDAARSRIEDDWRHGEVYSTGGGTGTADYYYYYFISLKTHTSAFTQYTFAQAFKKTSEAGCRRGTIIPINAGRLYN